MFINLPQGSIACRSLPSENPAAVRLAVRFKPARMLNLAIPGRTLPQPAA